MWGALVIAFAVTAAASDFWRRTIPRALTISAFVVGLTYHAIWGGLGSAALAVLVAFAVGMSLFSMGAIGGGDVKLITALGALLGFPLWSTAMVIAIFTAGLVALIGVVRRGLLRQTLHNIGEILRMLPQSGANPHPRINVGNPSLVRSPFGVAAALGTIVALVTV